ncbi:MAG: zinc ribbon domain-containing protein [Deltaproteobacteria bacterium]|nr:zinc ribbon domain-containing protein [Deltaproteobacteria bacterium]
MYCQRCKTDYPEGKKFCKECGSPLVEKGTICPKCLAPLALKPDEKYCNECGALLTQSISRVIKPKRRPSFTWLAIVFGFILAGLAGSIILYNYHKTPQRADTSTFLGHWTNEDSNTRSITRVNIRSGPSGTVFIRMWGKCHPEDCDWGEKKVNVDESERVISIEWRWGFGVQAQQLDILPDGRLRVLSNMRFTDNSGRQDYDSTDYFVKSTETARTQKPTQLNY